MAHLSGVSTLGVSLPKGGGDVRGLGGNFVADYNRGTGSYVLDLRLPAGPAGIRPALALAYNSGGANGAFGLGWALGVPSIHRDGERRFVRYDDTDGFRLDLHGELVRLADGRWRPRYDELFARIERGDHWEIFPKEGGVQRYGVDSEARIVHPDHPDRILAWALQEAEDRNGNQIRYRYVADGNNRYLGEVAYGAYRVVLAYAPRPDVFATARHGFPVTTALRCTSIEIHCDRLAGQSLIRRYALSYAEPAETPLSLLRQIQLTGHRAGETATMPPLTFGYTSFRPETGRCRPLVNPLGFALAPLGLPGTDLLDCTGDGLPDIVQIDDQRHCYWANRGDGSFDAPRQIRSLPDGAHLGAPGTSFGDADGDGAADLLVTEGPHTGYFPKTGPATWGPFQRYRRAPAYSLRDPNNRLVDLDADGQVDLLRTTPSAFVLHLNRGSEGWESLPPIPRVRDIDAFPDVSLADPRVQLADMTGDGLADIVLVRSGEVSYWPYEGLGRWGRRRVLAGSPAFARPEQPRRIFLSDVNGDGLADLVVVEGDVVTVWINRTGTGFAAPVRLGNAPPSGGADVRMADMLGAGTAGVLWSYESERRPRTRYFFLDLGGDEKPYLLSAIDNGLGKHTRIRYSSSSQFAARDRAEGHPWNTFLPFPVQVVAEVRQEDPLAGLSTWQEIRYHEGVYDGRERRFAGFGRVELVDHGDATAPALLTAMRFDATPTDGLGRDERALAVARWGKMLETTQGPPGGPVMRRSSSAWAANVAEHGTDGTPVATVHRHTIRNEAPGGAEGPVVIEHLYAFDDSGNVTRDQMSANGPAPLTLVSEVEFARTPDGRPSALPSRVTERRGDGALVRERRYYYDGEPFTGLPPGQATTGNLVRQSVRVLDEPDFAAHYGAEGLDAAALGYRTEDGAVWSDAGRYSYDARGNLAATRDPLGHETTLASDAAGVFPVRLQNAAGHVTRLRWDDAALQPDEMTDANGAVWRFGFDALGRVTALAFPGDSLADPGETVSYHLDASPPYVELQQKLADGMPPLRRRVFHDGSGQVRQTRAMIDEASVLVSAFESLNSRGWVASRGEPSIAGSLDFGPVPAGGVTTLQYDAIGRVVSAGLPGGRSTRSLYEPFRTVTYDANDTDASPANVARGFFDTPTIHRLDGQGRLVGVTELHDGLITSHAYRYDEAGQLVEATGPAGGRMLGQRFDLAGNRLALDHVDAGSHLFYYDAGGQLVRSADAAGRRIAIARDALGRPTGTAVDGMLAQNLVYDAPDLPNALGRLSTAHDEAGEWAFEYDSRGRPTRRTLSAPGRSWTLEHRYQANGQVAAIRYPDGAEVTFQYDRAGRLAAVPGALDALTYDAHGRRTSMRAANGVQTLLDYDPLTRFLARLRVLGPAGEVLHDLSYDRDNVGNVLGQRDGRPPGPDAPHPRRFILDGRYRLLEVDGGGSAAVGAYVRRYAYDAANNVVVYPTHAAAPIVYAPPGSNRIAGILDGGNLVPLYAHDANGNVVRLPGRDLMFDAFGRLAGVQRADGATVAYRYNAVGERVWRTATVAGAARRTLFLAGLYEEDDDGAVRRYLCAGGAPIAIDQAGGRTWLHGNELGHVMVLTDAAGALAGSRFFHPFGEAGGAGGVAVPCAFGGKILDEISGLYHFGARNYAPEIGRFVSPDPLYLTAPELALATPGLLNLYAYAGNNPMVYVDPSGLSPLGSALGGLVGGMVGAFVFVVSAGNPVLAGITGGLAGGAVAGGIDGGAKGAVVGGLLGALTGGIGGGALWGISALSGTLLGTTARQAVLVMLSTAAAGTTTIAGMAQVVDSGNWDILAGAAAGIAGAMIGSAIGNAIMMRNVWEDPNNSPRVKQNQREVQAALNNKANFDKVNYVSNMNPSGSVLGSQFHGTITMNKDNIGNSYLEYRSTQAHELYHQFQEQTVANFDQAYRAETSYASNRFENAAFDFEMRFMHFTPYPFQTYSHALAPALVAVAQPAGWEDRKSGEDRWRNVFAQLGI
ncbi:toxin TcdB middle/N-terminal domain-containing protein [Cupriavidus sp. 2TAF22]|uniref:toxin TcdB middle/N-terminal domain-containing protein n=1 Tax=unclassified Cupriavidus TaxID=2640874 RepID=UPI003F904F3A